MTTYRSQLYNALTIGMLLFGFTLPLSKSAGNVLLFLMYLIGATGLYLYKDFRESVHSNIKQPLTLAFSLFYLVALFGVFFTEKYADGFQVANKFFSLPAIYLMVSVLLQSVQDEGKRYQNAENIIFSFLIGLMVLNGIAAMTYLGIIGHKKFVLPLAPLSVHHIWFSNINAIGLYATASFLLFSRRSKSSSYRLFFILSAALAIICILLSLSRTAWFGAASTSVIMAFIAKKNKKIFAIILAAVAMVCVAGYSLIPIVHERINLIASDISQFSAGETSTSLGSRFLMWKASILMFLSNPLMGVGTGGYAPTMTEYIQSGKFPASLLEFNQPHNMYLFALATNGLAGLAALLFIFYRIMTFTLPAMKKKEDKNMLFAFLATAAAVHFMIAGLTDSFFNIQILRYTFVFIIGVCVRETATKGHRP